MSMKISFRVLACYLLAGAGGITLYVFSEVMGYIDNAKL